MADEHGMGCLDESVSYICSQERGPFCSTAHSDTCALQMYGIDPRSQRSRAMPFFFSVCSFPEAAPSFLLFSGRLFSASFGLVVFYVMPFEVQIKCGYNLKDLIIKNMIVLLF